MSQRSTAQHCHTNTPFCKSRVTWNFAVPVPHSEEIQRCIHVLLFLCTLVAIHLALPFHCDTHACARARTHTPNVVMIIQILYMKNQAWLRDDAGSAHDSSWQCASSFTTQSNSLILWCQMTKYYASFYTCISLLLITDDAFTQIQWLWQDHWWKSLII